MLIVKKFGGTSVGVGAEVTLVTEVSVAVSEVLGSTVESQEATAPAAITDVSNKAISLFLFIPIPSLNIF